MALACPTVGTSNQMVALSEARRRIQGDVWRELRIWCAVRVFSCRAECWHGYVVAAGVAVLWQGEVRRGIYTT